MKLAAWLEANNKTPSDLAVDIGEPAVNVWRYANGKRIPNKETMPKIVAATGGEVTANDFYDQPEALPEQDEPPANDAAA